ncbi:LOW QUALITY PROTEIN: putative methyltransferase TARBP1 [Rhynchocyon petersi]
MELVLAETLLAQNSDPRVLVAALCCGEATAERAETLRFLFQRLEDTGAGPSVALQEATREAALGFLVPLLREPGSEPPLCRRVLRAAAGALRACVRLAGGPQWAAALAEEALCALLVVRPNPGAGGGLCVEAAAEVLGAVSSGLRSQAHRALLERAARAMLALALGEADEAAQVAARLLPVLGRAAEALRALWTDLRAAAGPSAARRLLVLSALAEQLLPGPDVDLDARRCPLFWTSVQAGLTQADDALTRKRARYLLQRAVEVSARCSGCACDPQGQEPIVFWWCEKKKDELLTFWEDYILIMETLEANQIHVVKPVLPKLNNLFEYTVSEEKELWLLHPSWHLCIYKRMFESENKVLTKEGVTHFLELHETKMLPFSPEFCEFVLGPLMDTLSETPLYSRDPGQLIGSGSPLGLKLQNFLVIYVSLLPEEVKSSFLLKFIQKMSTRHWCAVPILFLSKALASVPRCKVLGAEGLLALRDVLQCTMITHQILLRGAAQCYLLQAAMNLVDAEEVSLSDVSTFLASLRQDESLRRGTSLWTELCDWLRINEHSFQKPPGYSSTGLHETSCLKAYVKSLVQEYVRPPAAWETGENSFQPEACEAKLVAVMILLAVDVEARGGLHSEKRRMQDVLRILLEPLLEALMKLGTNAYMSLLKTDRCLQLLLKLLHTSLLRGSSARDDEVFTLLQNSVMSTTESVSEFILRRLTMNELCTVSDLDRCHLYLMVLTELINLHLKVGWRRGSPLWRVISSLKNASVQCLQEVSVGNKCVSGGQIPRAVSMATLAMVCKAMDQNAELQPDPLDAGPMERFLSSLQLNQTLQKSHAEGHGRYPHMETSIEDGCHGDTVFCFSVCDGSSGSQGWGRVVAQYVHDQWVCLSFLLRKYHTLIPAAEDETQDPFLPAVQMPVRTLQSALEALTILPSDRVLPVFQTMKVLVPKLLSSCEALCIEAFEMAWKILASLSNTQLIFWSNLKAFVQFVFDNQLLMAAAKLKGQAYLKIKEIMYKIIDMSAVKTGVFNTLINYCCESWIVSPSHVSQGSLSCAQNYSELVLEACIFGTVFRRDQRLVHEVQTFVENLGHQCAANAIIENAKREDHYVRICAVKFLCLLDGSNMSHKLFLEDLAIKLLDKDESVSKSRTRYYMNSLQHRVKTRIWQTLLLLFPRFDQNFLNGIIDRIFQAGFLNNQASIKYLVEWMIILILHKFPQFLPKFWDCFSYGEEKFKTSICTFLSVLSHLDVIIQDIPEKKLILKQALVTALQWGLSHNFSVRLYALLALKKIWVMCTTSHVQELAGLASVVESSLNQMESMHGTGNANKNWQRIQDHFFFAAFHPLKDYCLETIFDILPRLSGLVEDEWIAIEKFTQFTDIPCDSGFQWCLSESQLCQLKPGDWTQRDLGPNPGEADGQSEWTDMQKKIIPWKHYVPDLEPELGFQDRAVKLGKSTGRLIVVGSLIDKPTNLGGLCRTCEIFGVSALVLGSLRHVTDTHFQHLSVHAEQWLPLLEVQPAQLTDYLREKKTEGYTVIGVEQTARSVELTQYRFPEKSLLLLGNEREGIPANLIQQLDVCVEIPQQGVTRSLNVHVSGALLIWEYTRQQLLRR